MKQNNKKNKSKPAKLYDEIFISMKKGKFKAGDQLPPERQLADDSNMSYMTARQAVQKLVDQGYIIKRQRVGTFIPFDIKDRLARSALNIIGLKDESVMTRQFKRQALIEADKLGYFGNMFEVTTDNLDQAIRILNQHDRPCISLMNPFFTHKEFRQAFLNNPHTILVGYDLSGMGIRSVLCDDAAAARMATSLLQKKGHREIAFIGGSPSHPVMQQMIAGWQSSFAEASNETIKKRFLNLETITDPKKIEQKILKTITKKTWSASASICASSHIALTFVKTLQSIGMSIPKDHSVISLGLSESLPHYNPIITCVDVRLDEQIKYAVESVQNFMNNKPVDLLHLVRPQIIKGQTVENK